MSYIRKSFSFVISNPTISATFSFSPKFDLFVINSLLSMEFGMSHCNVNCRLRGAIIFNVTELFKCFFMCVRCLSCITFFSSFKIYKMPLLFSWCSTNLLIFSWRNFFRDVVNLSRHLQIKKHSWCRGKAAASHLNFNLNEPRKTLSPSKRRSRIKIFGR